MSSRLPNEQGARTARPKRPRGTLIGGAILAVIIASCFFTLPWTLGRGASVTASGASAGATTPRRYERSNLDHILLPPSWSPHREDERERLRTDGRRGGPVYLFGTDRLGRDLFVRCLAGGGISLLIGLAAAAIAVCIGTSYGAVSGFFGGRTDAILMRIVDVLYGLPYILLVVLLAVAVDGWMSGLESAAMSEPGRHAFAEMVLAHRGVVNVVTLLIAIGGVSWLTVARVVRGQVLSLKEQPFMEACRAIGVPVSVQFRRHLLPNLIGPIVVYATLTVPQAILQESFLSFLGIGVQPPLPSWGNLAADGLSELNPVRSRWWLLLWPCLFLAITLLSLNFLGEGLRESFDPKRRRNPARSP